MQMFLTAYFFFSDHMVHPIVYYIMLHTEEVINILFQAHLSLCNSTV